MRPGLLALPLLVLLAACSTPAWTSPPLGAIPVPPSRGLEAHEVPAAPHAAMASAPATLDVAAVDAWVAGQVREQGLVGLSLAIVRDGKTVLAKGYGLASREAGTPVEASTAFALGSVTKEFTCASVLALAEAGKLSLRDKVARYYPELPRAKEISLADLGAHVSGYPDYYPLDFLDSRMQRAIAPDDLLHQYVKEPLDFAPGTRWSYSNTGYVLLGRVVEKVSGEPFGKFLGERVLSRAGMQHASFAPPVGTPGIATGYESFALGPPAAAPREPEAWLFSAGALYASAPDLAAWDLALVDGKILKPESLRQMTTPRVLSDGRSTMYGCGLSVDIQRGETILRHNGEVNGFLAENAFIPRTRSAVVLLTNGQFGDPSGIFRAVLRLVVQDGLGGAKPPAVVGPTPREVGLAMLRSMQAGRVDRSQLGAEFSLFLNEARLREAAASLGPLGEPSDTEADPPRERGGMEVSTIRFGFPGRRLLGLLYRSPDGKVQEFLVFKP